MRQEHDGKLIWNKKTNCLESPDWTDVYPSKRKLTQNCMSLTSQPGSKIIFHGNGGYVGEQVQAKTFLQIGKEYTVQTMDVGGFTSYVYLEEMPSKRFNTTMFSNY